MPWKRFARDRVAFVALLSLAAIAGGCSLLGNKNDEPTKDERLRELLDVPEPPDLIRQAASPHGLRPIQVDGVALVGKLPGTGGPADPSAYVDELLEEMKRDDIQGGPKLLEQPETALVRVRTVVPPGARRGDRIDIRVLSPPRSRVSDLHTGVLAKTRLRHQQRIRGAIRESEVMVIGQGAILTRANYEPGKDDTLRIEGSVLSGGIVQVDRSLGLLLKEEFEHAKMASGLANAINRRFFFFDGTTRRGIANAVEDDFIELDLHPRYRENVHRLMAVIRAIGVKPESSQSQKRLAELAARLANPSTAADAALQLEAIGESAIPTLLEGIQSDNPELRFYAAEALAYLDRSEAIGPLEEAAREVAAFRHDALMALQEMDSSDVIDALQRLMQVSSMETRYGAFCALRRRPTGRQHLLPYNLGVFEFYEVESDAPPAVVISLRENPEIVVFGKPAPLQVADFITVPGNGATGGLTIRPDRREPGQLRILRFKPGEDDGEASVDNSVASMIKGIASAGGRYGEVVMALRIAKDKGFLIDQLAIDPLPRPLRTYYRETPQDEDSQRSRRRAEIAVGHSP